MTQEVGKFAELAQSYIEGCCRHSTGKVLGPPVAGSVFITAVILMFNAWDTMKDIRCVGHYQRHSVVNPVEVGDFDSMALSHTEGSSSDPSVPNQALYGISAMVQQPAFKFVPSGLADLCNGTGAPVDYEAALALQTDASRGSELHNYTSLAVASSRSASPSQPPAAALFRTAPYWSPLSLYPRRRWRPGSGSYGGAVAAAGGGME